MESLEQKLKGQAAELAEETANHEARHTLLEEQVLELQRDIKVKISELTSASTEIESLQQRCLALQEDVGSMTNMRDAAETELEGVRQQVVPRSVAGCLPWLVGRWNCFETRERLGQPP